MSIFDTLISKLAPHSCLGCGLEGSVLCASCTKTLKTVSGRCYRCQLESPNFLTCAACYQTSQLYSVHVAAIYESTAKHLIWKLKLAGGRTAAAIMAQPMAVLLNNTDTEADIVPVPTATSRARQRGYDQAKLLAREIARQTRLPYRDCLARSGQTHQHGLPRHQRLAQLATAFRVKRPGSIHKARIILVDDVMTTGATLEAAAAALSAAGVARIEAVVFAQPELSTN